VSVRALGALGMALLGLWGCGGSLPASAVPRPIGEDLVALLPSGAELVVDVDLQQLRTWDEIDRVLALLPPAGRARLEQLGPHWMNDLDALALAAWRSENLTQSVLLLRGDLDDKRIPALLAGEAQRGEIDGRTSFQSGDEVALRLGRRLLVVASPVEVRRVAEIVRGEAEGVRDARADRPLRDALGKAPTARTGRAAVIGAAIAGPLMNERFEAAGLAGARPAKAAFAVAVGDGVDAVLVLSLPSVPEATALRQDLDHGLRDLRARPIIRMLGLQDAFDFVSAVRDRDLRIAYRIPGQRLARFLDRLDRAKQAVESRDAGSMPSPPQRSP
jgi:hypothetical protein